MCPVVKVMFFYDRELPIFSVVLSRFYNFHIDTFIYKESAAIIGYCGLLTYSEKYIRLFIIDAISCVTSHALSFELKRNGTHSEVVNTPQYPIIAADPL
jgi:hypothetical protein